MHQYRFVQIPVFISVFFFGGSLLSAPSSFKVGDEVEVYSSMTQRWERATIQSVDGGRYFVHAKDPAIVNAYWGATAAQVRPPGAANAEQPSSVAPKPAVAVPQPGQQSSHAEPAATKPPQKTRRPEGSSQIVTGADGQKHLRAIASPGDAKPMGTWLLKTGGQAVLQSRTKNGDGSITNHYEWAKQEEAGSLTINADGTFIHIQPGGQREAGTWSDFGNNIVELKGYDGATWTASVWNGELEVIHPVGMTDWAYRP